MAFITAGFLAFVPFAALISYLIPGKWRYLWLLLVSYLFYMAQGPWFILVMLASTVSTYAAGLLLEKAGKSGGSGGAGDPGKASGKKKMIAALTIVFNIGLIVVFKYLGMLIPSLRGSIIAPAGMSFYILMAMGYLIDVYRGKISAEKNFALYALFVSFFPQVLCGPIERAGHMLPQFKNPKKFSYTGVRDGLLIMVWGYFLKLVIADRIAIYVDAIYENPEMYHGTLVVVGLVLYAFQIYCDFGGYSYIALGCAKVIGIDVIDNFQSPYLAGTIAGFWRRWHISLSTWFRDYLYIPLGGNRKGRLRQYLNILIVFAVSGLWHGADLTYMVWGLIHGLYQVFGYILKPVRNGLVRALGISRESFSHRLMKVLVTFVLHLFAWIFFRATSMEQAMSVLKNIKGFQPWYLFDGTVERLGLDRFNLILLAMCLGLLFVVDLARAHGVSVLKKITSQGLWLRWAIYIGVIMLILVCGIWGPSYNATTFIYSQF